MTHQNLWKTAKAVPGALKEAFSFKSSLKIYEQKNPDPQKSTH